MGEPDVHVDQLRPGSDRGCPLAAVDAEPAHEAQIQDHASGHGRVAGVAVATGAGNQAHPVGDRPADRAANIEGVEGKGHSAGANPVEALVIDMGCVREASRARRHHWTAHRLREGARHRWPGRAPRPSGSEQSSDRLAGPRAGGAGADDAADHPQECATVERIPLRRRASLFRTRARWKSSLGRRSARHPVLRRGPRGGGAGHRRGPAPRQGRRRRTAGRSAESPDRSRGSPS
jgi:hypothetical protein